MTTKKNNEIAIRGTDVVVKPNLLDKAITVIAPKWGNERLIERVNRETFLSLQYKGAEQNRLRANWNIWDNDANPDEWELEVLRNRSRDLNRNDPVAAGATETLSQNIVGKGLRPQAKIRADRLGISKEKARELNKTAEQIFATWSKTSDCGNRLNFDEQQYLALRKVIEDGEIIALPAMGDEDWREIKRCIELIEVDRLVEKSDFQSGICTGKRGQVTKYNLQNACSSESVEIDAFDSRGRPKVLHIFQTKRPGQNRGVPLFAPVLNYFKDLGDYVEAAVMAARVSACLAVFITKNSNSYSTAFNQSNATDVEGNRIQGLQPAMISYLEAGEDIKVVEPKQPGNNYDDFITTQLRLIGIGVGLPYELMAKDFSRTNFASAKASLMEGRRLFTNWRHWFSQKFNQPIYNMVLEEAFLRGLFPVKDFYENIHEYTRAIWIGGAWGWIDPGKEVEAARKAIDYGLSTQAEEAAGQGRDWEEIIEQQERENEFADEHNVKLLQAGKTLNIEAVVEPEETGGKK